MIKLGNIDRNIQSQGVGNFWSGNWPGGDQDARNCHSQTISSLNQLLFSWGLFIGRFYQSLFLAFFGPLQAGRVGSQTITSLNWLWLSGFPFGILQMQRKLDFGNLKEIPFRWKIGPTLTKSDISQKWDLSCKNLTRLTKWSSIRIV